MKSFWSILGVLFDIFLLVVTPILIASFAIAARRREALTFTLRGWLRFPIALALTTACEFGLGAVFLAVNPFVYSSTHRPFLVLSLLSLGYLTINIPIHLFHTARPVEHHHLQITFQTYTLWWFVLALPAAWLISLVGIQYTRLILVSLVLCLLAALFDRFISAESGEIRLGDEMPRPPVLQPQSPLFPRPMSPGPISPGLTEAPPEVEWKRSALSGVFDIPFILLLGTLTALGIDLTMNYYYHSTASAYVRTTSAVILMVSTLAPFTHNFHRIITSFFALLFISTTFLTLAAFPFSNNAPLRLHFTHSIDLIDGSTFSELSGPRGFFERQVLQDEWFTLPPTRRAVCGVPSRFHAVSRGSAVCRWPGPTTRIWPYPPTHWIKNLEEKQLGFTKGVLVVSGPAFTHLSGLALDPAVTLEGYNRSERIDPLPPIDDGRRGVPWERVFILTWRANATKSERGGYVLLGWDETPDSGDVPDLHAVLTGVPDWVRVSGPSGSKQPLVDGFRRFDF